MSSRQGKKKQQQESKDEFPSSSSVGTNMFLNKLNTFEDLLSIDLDAEEEEITRQIREGRNSELQQRAVVLQKLREKQILAADRHRKQQIKNINQLYEYEVEDAQALYNKAFAELQDQMLQEIAAEKMRLKSLQKQYHESLDTFSTHQSDNPTSVTSIRALRSTVNTDSVASSNSNPSRKRNQTTAFGNNSVVNHSLSEQNIRSDFLEIVRDMQLQQAEFVENTPKANFLDVKLLDDGFIVNGEEYGIGDSISIYSVVSNETFSGLIIGITNDEVTIRCPTGPRFRFLFSQLKQGRIGVCPRGNKKLCVNSPESADQANMEPSLN